MKAVSGADRNIPCSKCGKKLKDCKGHINKSRIGLLVVGVSLVILVGVLVFRSNMGMIKMPLDRMVFAEGQVFGREFRTSDSYGITLENFTHEDSQVLYQTIIAPVITYLANQFPVSNVRKEFAGAVDDYGIGRKYDISFTRAESNTWMYVRGERSRAHLVFNMLVWARFIRFLEQTGDLKFGREQLENQLATVFLHEHCHVTRQDFWKSTKEITKEEYKQNEAECHGYSTDVARMLIKGGRNIQAGYHQENEFYDKVGRNWKDPAWIEYVDRRPPGM